MQCGETTPQTDLPAFFDPICRAPNRGPQKAIGQRTGATSFHSSAIRRNGALFFASDIVRARHTASGMRAASRSLLPKLNPQSSTSLA
jgi:hypothetical protein